MRTVRRESARSANDLSCGLCRMEFTDLSGRRATCHVLGVPGQGIAKCENRADLDEDTRLELMDCCLAVKACATCGAGGPSPIAGGGEVNPKLPSHVHSFASSSSFTGESYGAIWAYKEEAEVYQA